MKVILAAGGSGGHIFPSVALASELKKNGVQEISFVSSKRRLDRNILKDTEHTCYFLSVNPMPLGFNPIRIIVFIAKLFVDTIRSLYLIVKLRPDVVVGFGGYSSGAIVGCAKLLGTSILIHEQNFLPGRANKILSHIADSIAVSFKDSGKYFPHAEKKIFYSGNPLRIDMLSNDREKSAHFLGLSPEKLTILVMGGSQGSSFLNSTVSEVARQVKDKKGDSVQFIHLTGKKDYESVKRFYAENEISGKVFSFLEKIDDAYAASDLAISRAGAAAVFELAFYAKPMILIPYPNPKNNQRTNAEYFSQAEAAIYKEEKDLSPDSLSEEVFKVLTDEEYRRRLSSRAGNLSIPDAGQRLAEEVMRLGNKDK